MRRVTKLWGLSDALPRGRSQGFKAHGPAAANAIAIISVSRPCLRHARLLLIGLLVLAITLPALARTTRDVLGNGLELVVIEDRRAPTVIQMLWYRVGAMDESSGRSGLAHVVEHLMFKGTERFAAGEFSAVVSAAGGRENAFTSRDYTGYYQQVPVGLLEAVMTREADRMDGLTFTDSQFASEMKVVMEERRARIEDSPGGLVNEQLMATAFVASPYRRPIIGWMSDLQHLTADDARRWYQDWYAPNNAILVIAGDVQYDVVRALAEKTYGQVARKQVPVTRPQHEPEQTGTRRVRVKAPAQAGMVSLAFKVPGLQAIDDGADPFALAMLSAVLSNGDTGRLTRELVRGQRVANAAWAGYSMLARGPVLFTLGGRPATGRADADLEAALIDQVRRVASDGVAADELARIKAGYIASQVYKKDSLFAQVSEAGTMRLAGFELDDATRILDGIRRVTPADVQRVAARYFSLDRLTVATLDPQPVAAGAAEREAGQ